MPDKNNPFAIALLARKGEIEPEAIPTPAARRIYNDSSLSDEALAGYVEPRQPARRMQFNRQNHQMRAKRS